MEDAGVRELRLALVCHGPVAQAVWSFGVVSELHRLVRAAAALEAGGRRNPFPPGQSEHVWWDLLREQAAREGVRTRVVVDVLAGASAAGVNAIGLAKAIAHDRSLRPLRAFWLEHADLARLRRDRRLLPRLRLPARRRLYGAARPPLRGDVPCQRLYDALAEMDAARGHAAGQRLLPAGCPLELLVTLTDLRGRPRWVAGPAGRSWRHVLRFRTGADRDQLGAAHTAALAFAAAATAALPGAFPPLTLDAFRRHLGRRACDPAAVEGLLLREHQLTDRPAAAAPFADGGALAAPLEWILEACFREPAATEATRRVLWVEPDPPLPVPAGDRRGGLAAWEGLAGAPRRERAAADLDWLAERNQRAARLAELARATAEDVRRALADAVAELGEDGAVTVRHLAELDRRMHEQAQRWTGQAYRGYVAAKLQAAADALAEVVCGVLRYPAGCGHAEFTRAALRAWVALRHPPEPGELVSKAQRDFLRTFDLPYGQRRLALLLATVDELYPGGRVARAALDRTKAALVELLARLRAAAAPADVRADVGAMTFTPFTELRLATLDGQERSPRAFAERHAEELDRLAGDVGRRVDACLAGAAEETWRALVRATGDWPPPARTLLLARYLGFPLWDALLYPLLLPGGVEQLLPVEVVRLAPGRSHRLAAERATARRDPHPASTFARRATREHDYLWGRLEGAEQLLAMLVPDAPDGRYKQLFLTILEEERPSLPSTARLVAKLYRAVAGLGTPPAGPAREG